MSSDGPKTGYAFVIDTDSYAGNFERELCAHVTGTIGECEAGEEYVEDLPINFDNVQHVADDNGTYRPVSIWKSPIKNSYDSVAIFFDKKPSQEQIDFMKERSKTFIEKNKQISSESSFYRIKEFNITGYRLIRFVHTAEEEI